VNRHYFERIENLEEAIVGRCATSPRTFVRIPAITGGRKWHEKASLSIRTWYELPASNFLLLVLVSVPSVHFDTSVAFN
jgi:hypothetical protein